MNQRANNFRSDLQWWKLSLIYHGTWSNRHTKQVCIIKDSTECNISSKEMFKYHVWSASQLTLLITSEEWIDCFKMSGCFEQIIIAPLLMVEVHCTCLKKMFTIKSK